MSSSHPSVVIRHCDEVVDGLPVVGVDDVGRHVEAAGGELDVGVELVPPVAVVAETLQAHHEQTGKGPQVELLRRLLVLLAARAVPEIDENERS